MQLLEEKEKKETQGPKLALILLPSVIELFNDGG